MSEETIDFDRFCIACGYNLRAIASDRCPECGTEFDVTASTESQIPWSHRASLGRWRAFWKTVRLVLVRPQQLAKEMQRPVSLADALAFRRRVALIGSLPFIAGATFGYLSLTQLNENPWFGHDPIGSTMQWIGLLVVWVSVYIWSLFCTGLASYWFHPGHLPVEQQNRAVALSYYACASSVYWPITALLFFSYVAMVNSRWLRPDRGPMIPVLLWMIAVCTVSVLQCGFVWLRPLKILKLTTQAGVMRQWSMAILLPLLKLMLLVLIVGGINFAYWLICMMLLSVV